MKTWAPLAVALTLLCSLVAASARAEEQDARGFIQDTGDQVLVVLKNQSLSSDQKVHQIEDIAYARFDFDTMAKLVLARNWSKLTPEQQKIMMEVGASLEQFAKDAAQADDKELANVFGKAGAKVVDMDEAAFLKWQAIAKDTAYKDFETNVKDGKKLLDMALSVK